MTTKRHIVTAAVLFILLAGLACLTSCTKYSSHYSAVMLVQTNTQKEASVHFSTLSGRMVLKMKSTSDSEQRLDYSVSLGEGSLSIKVDCAGTTTDLPGLNGGDSHSGNLDNIGVGTVYVIIETDGKCRDGKLEFTLE